MMLLAGDFDCEPVWSKRHKIVRLQGWPVAQSRAQARARGMRDEEMLLLKLKWATAHPIRSAREFMRFLTVRLH
jgi:hypothetical protein